MCHTETIRSVTSLHDTVRKVPSLMSPRSGLCALIQNANQVSIYLLLNGKAISQRQNHVYLGTMPDDNFNDELEHENSLHSRGNDFVNHFKEFSTGAKYHLLKVYFSNAYRCQLWATYHTLVMTSFPVPCNDVYTWLFSIRRGISIPDIFVNKGIDGLSVLRRKLIYSFMRSVHTVITFENPLI